MSVIHIDFRDKEHYLLVRLVEEQLDSFGFDIAANPIPEDAIACALDEVKKFATSDLRKAALVKLEAHFRKRRQAEMPIPIAASQTKPKP
ncbi:MAG TPA: hypothetical protein VE954_02460 [Oligoflexus sp.]|uniref:hypothetical protein n=1 Tax=Oligoflexus sp. TaxID=1971216 RepID=UPI002D40BAAD|nr:hypothetical protein [Oligoflexus sp.]HYX31949.1 hypothetical protein [Oligoflexus sp.]